MYRYNRNRKKADGTIPLKKRLELDAIAWKGGVSYGKFAAKLTSEDREQIVKEYLAELRRREAEKNERVERHKAEAARNKKTKTKPKSEAADEEMCG